MLDEYLHVKRYLESQPACKPCQSYHHKFLQSHKKPANLLCILAIPKFIRDLGISEMAKERRRIRLAPYFVTLPLSRIMQGKAEPAKIERDGR
jgi:hypothetical protein